MICSGVRRRIFIAECITHQTDSNPDGVLRCPYNINGTQLCAILTLMLVFQSTSKIWKMQNMNVWMARAFDEYCRRWELRYTDVQGLSLFHRRRLHETRTRKSDDSRIPVVPSHGLWIFAQRRWNNGRIDLQMPTQDQQTDQPVLFGHQQQGC